MLATIDLLDALSVLLTGWYAGGLTLAVALIVRERLTDAQRRRRTSRVPHDSR